MPCEENEYTTTNAKTYFWRPGNNFSKLAPPMKEADPNLIPGHAFNNVTVNDLPTLGRTWDLPTPKTREEYHAFLNRLKEKKPDIYKKYFTNPDVDIVELTGKLKNNQLTTYQSGFSPTDYVARKEWVKWSRSKLDTSRFSYQPTTYRTMYGRVTEIKEIETLSKALLWSRDSEDIKKKLRKIWKTGLSSYYVQFCELPLPGMAENLNKGKTWKQPTDAYTLRRV